MTTGATPQNATPHSTVPQNAAPPASPAHGFFSMSGDPVILEIAARHGFDFVVVDVQHGPHSPVALRTQMQAIEAGGSHGFVRIAAVSGENVGIALDSGARGLIAPLVNTAEDARALVRFAMYPPTGIRSYGVSRRSDLTTAPILDINAQIALFVMIETPSGLAHVEEIAAVDGITGLYVGPTDLSLALGGTHMGDPGIAEAFEAALVTILDAAHRHGKQVAFHGRTAEAIAPRLAQGFTAGVLASDLTLLDAVIGENLARLREGRPA